MVRSPRQHNCEILFESYKFVSELYRRDSENRLEMEIHLLNRICKDSGLQISTRKTKVMAFRGTDPVRAKIVIYGTVLEQVSNCYRWYCPCLLYTSRCV